MYKKEWRAISPLLALGLSLSQKVSVKLNRVQLQLLVAEKGELNR